MTRTRAQAGALSRRKGASFERHVVRILQDAGIGCRRNTGQAGSARVQGCDIEDTDWWIECCHAKGADPAAKYEQAVRDQESGADVADGWREWRPIVVIWRRDGMRETLATMAMVDMCALAGSDGKPVWYGVFATVGLEDWCRMAVAATRTRQDASGELGRVRGGPESGRDTGHAGGLGGACQCSADYEVGSGYRCKACKEAGR